MKKIICGVMAILLSFALLGAKERAVEIPIPKENTLSGTLPAGGLQAAVEARFGTAYDQVRKIEFSKGELTPADCKFIREKLRSLEVLILSGSADFSGSQVPKSAFDGLTSLRAVSLANTREVGAKAFSLCSGLETAELPKVTRTGVQAFAQAKGGSDSHLTEVCLPSLQELNSRGFYYCTALTSLTLGAPPRVVKPEGKEGLWFERASELTIFVPDRQSYDAYMRPENCQELDWSAFRFEALNGDPLPKAENAAAYIDAEWDSVREGLIAHFDRSDKDFSGGYYTGDYKFSLNFYTFNQNLNAWLNNSGGIPPLDTKQCIRWAAEAGFDAVDITCYYIPGYSNTTMPTKPEAEILRYARELRKLCAQKHLAISGTGLQNNFADPNAARRATDIERIQFWIKVAAEMGAPVIRIFAGPPPADIRREGWEKIARERIVPAVQQVADYAREHYPSVRIGLQNHGGMLATANQVIQVLSWIDRDNVGIVNDTGFYRDFMSTDARQYDWYRDIALVLPYTSNFQLKKKPAGAETSTLMDLERVARDIRMSPYRGYIPLELLWVSKDPGYPGSLDTPPYEETRAFLEKVRQAFELTRSRTLTLGDDMSLQNVASVISLPPGYLVSAASSEGRPRLDSETLQDGDVITLIAPDGKTEHFRVEVWREELENIALNTPSERIKVSSFAKGASKESAFDGITTGTSGSGLAFDKSQTGHPEKSRIWLAADLGSVQRIDQVGLAWGTSVGNLRKRLKDGVYSVWTSSDPAVWEALSNASGPGKSGLDSYAPPSGWEELYAQLAADLPDANGSKIFIKALDTPAEARYILVCGEAVQSTVEIYDLMVFREKRIRGNKPKPSYPREHWVDILPVYPGMHLSPGVPALARVGTPWPSFYLEARVEVQLRACLVQDGVTVGEASASLLPGKAQTLSFNGEVSRPGCWEVRFEGTDAQGRRFFDKRFFTAVTGDTPADGEKYPALRLRDDRLVYAPDYKGNRVGDFSHAGYGGGGVPIPSVPTRLVLQPTGKDDGEAIQRAIDLLSIAPPDADGFRGALLLKAGTYRVSRPLYIRASGIVIRGEGDGHASIERHAEPIGPRNWRDYSHLGDTEAGVTRIIATWESDSYDKSVGIFNIAGAQEIQTGPETAILDQYLPTGATVLHLEDVSGFQAGDRILLTRVSNAAWAADLKMDAITEAPGILSANQWARNGKLDKTYARNSQERTVASVDAAARTLTLAEPVSESFDRQYGCPTACTCYAPGRIDRIGIEQIQLLSAFDPSMTGETTAFGVDYKYYSDECHAQVGVMVRGAEDVWIRELTTYHIDVATSLAGGSRCITVQDVNCLEPVSGTGGERRYSFANSGASFVLLNRCYARYTRHAFIVMGQVNGPNVFLRCSADYQFDASEPHLRWSTAGLYDNVRSRIYVQNRWNNGTAHGWAGSNYVLYNCDGKFIISQNPLTPNYLFGQSSEADRLPFVMNEVDPGHVPNFKAYEYSTGRKMTPESLYLQQLAERKGGAACTAVEARGQVPAADESAGFRDRFALLSSLKVGKKNLSAFNPEKTDYEIPLDIDYTALPTVKAKAPAGTRISVEHGELSEEITASAPGRFPVTYRLRFQPVPKERISGTDSTPKDLEALLDKDPKTSWSRPGTPVVQFYLGDKPVEIESVTLGYSRNTQSRRQYYFSFEVSDDGRRWTPVRSEGWTPDNLGKGHQMGAQVAPGPGNKASDQETFRFPAGVKGRLLRISMYGCRMGQGSGTANANAYWMADVKTREL